jgi:hypothetical protein
MDAEVSTHTFLTMIIEESVCFMSYEPIIFCNYSYVVHTEYIYFFPINWTVRMSNNLPERVQILDHAHIICITVRENRIICCQIFCDLLLKSAFERILNVMQLILVKIKWHIKWKYLIQKFHDICLSYYFKYQYFHLNQWEVEMFILLLLFFLIHSFTVNKEMSFIFTNIAFVVKQSMFLLTCCWTPCCDASGLKRLFDSFVFFII